MCIVPDVVAHREDHRGVHGIDGLNILASFPQARNTVIIEVSKSVNDLFSLPLTYSIRFVNRAIGDDKRKLLGQHTWKDILLNPSDGEKGHRSGIFYCIYNNLREVQKEGAFERCHGVSIRRSNLFLVRLEKNRL